MRFRVVVIFLLSSFNVIAQKNIKLSSPNKQLSFSFQISKEGLFIIYLSKTNPSSDNSSISLDFPGRVSSKKI